MGGIAHALGSVAKIASPVAQIAMGANPAGVVAGSLIGNQLMKGFGGGGGGSGGYAGSPVSNMDWGGGNGQGRVPTMGRMNPVQAPPMQPQMPTQAPQRPAFVPPSDPTQAPAYMSPEQAMNQPYSAYSAPQNPKALARQLRKGV